ncbi:hypothetical protein KR044_009729 [Drosophila immigrans]|nr:hypothetical protein KR044_009729 [Drosophila immigrans]
MQFAFLTFLASLNFALGTDTFQRKLFVRHPKCMYLVDPGPCHGRLRMYGFDPFANMCSLFIYGGCGGNPNRFPDYMMCSRDCLNREQESDGAVDYGHDREEHHEHPEEGEEDPEYYVDESELKDIDKDKDKHQHSDEYIDYEDYKEEDKTQKDKEREEEYEDKIKEEEEEEAKKEKEEKEDEEEEDNDDKKDTAKENENKEDEDEEREDKNDKENKDENKKEDKQEEDKDLKEEVKDYGIEGLYEDPKKEEEGKERENKKEDEYDYYDGSNEVTTGKVQQIPEYIEDRNNATRKEKRSE